MADQREGGISWTEETWNPIRGCTRVSEGCRNCYAETVAARFSDPGQPYHGLATRTPSGPRWTGKVVMVPDHLEDPLRWRRPRLIFVNSMSDLFHEALTFDQIDQVVAVMALANWHTFQVLTKRPARMAAYLIDPKTPWRIQAAKLQLGYSSILGQCPLPLPNVWWGTSAEHQTALDDRLPHLLACRQQAAVLWLSLEPLLGPVRLNPWWRRCIHGAAVQCPQCPNSTGTVAVDWVVVGGESGPGARPMNPAWARQLRDECLAARVPFHFKQWGEWTPGANVERQRGTVPTATWWNGGWKLGQDNLAKHDGHVDDEPDLYRVGKKAAGRLLDGVMHEGMPAVPAGRQ